MAGFDFAFGDVGPSSDPETDRAHVGHHDLRSSCTGIAAYDRTRWSGPKPNVSHVVCARDGVSLLLQHGEGVEDGLVIDTRPEPNHRLLVRRRLAPRVRADVGGTRFDGPQHRGAFVIIPAGAPARFVTNAATFGMTVQVHLDPALIRRAQNALGGDASAPLSPMFGAADPLVLGATEALLAEAGRRDPCGVSWRVAAEALSLRLAGCGLGLRWKPASRHGGLAPWQVRRVRDLMEAAIDQPLTLAELAAAAGLSPFHFCRAFRDTLGETPFEHLARLRLERAMMLLAETDKSVIEVALDVGYETESGLARLFRRALGIAPSVYRAQWRR